MPKTNPKQKFSLLTMGIAALVIAVIFGSLGYLAAYHKYSSNEVPTHNTFGYVVGQEASDQVVNFYKQYSNPRIKQLDKLVGVYGSNNLVFYRAYYQHGFDPITCSTMMPVKITPIGSTSGTTSIVTTRLEYPDHSKQVITSNVVLSNDGLKIDSISCPGDKSNLPPINP